jgi:hypothetical protein
MDNVREGAITTNTPGHQVLIHVATALEGQIVRRML